MSNCPQHVDMVLFGMVLPCLLPVRFLRPCLSNRVQSECRWLTSGGSWEKAAQALAVPQGRQPGWRQQGVGAVVRTVHRWRRQHARVPQRNSLSQAGA